MKRWEIINKYIQRYGYKNYLEIGLESGLCRDHILAKNKTTVDPATTANNPTHRMSSDDFFAQNSEIFDCIFIDGLHHGDQVLNDIENALKCLRKGGMIFCHDMLPNSEEVQRVPRPMPPAEWVGSCWQAWAKLKGTREDLNMFIVASDWGVGVIKRGKQKIHPELDVSLEKMDWEFYQKHRDKFNYKNMQEFEEILDKI